MAPHSAAIVLHAPNHTAAGRVFLPCDPPALRLNDRNQAFPSFGQIGRLRGTPNLTTFDSFPGRVECRCRARFLAAARAGSSPEVRAAGAGARASSRSVRARDERRGGMKLPLLFGTCVVLSLGMADVAMAQTRIHTTSGVHGDGSANVTCFLNQFRGMTADEARSQGINLEHLLVSQLSFGSRTFSLTLMVLGALMMYKGWELFTGVLFLAGFGGGFMFSFTFLSSVFNAFPTLFNCWVLSLLPLICGCIAGILVQKTLNLAFFLVGAGMGGVFGKYAYNLGLFTFEDHAGSIRWVYWACILVPAVLCGCASIRQQKNVLAFATSLIGGFAFMVGTCFLILHPINHRFTNWISPSNFVQGGDGLSEDAHLDGYTLGPIFFAIVLSALGTRRQLYSQQSIGGVSQSVVNLSAQV